MSGRNNSKSTAVKEFVTVAFAEDMDLARQYKNLLEENGISCAVKEQPDTSTTFPGIAVLVPEGQLDEAHQIIETQCGCGEFFDMAFQDPLYDNFNYEADDEDEM